MIRLGVLLAASTVLILLWHECGEDVGVFCYRMGMGAFTTLRSRALVPVPASESTVSRNRSACSNPSSTSYTRSIALKD
jgi:hypothetical protein